MSPQAFIFIGCSGSGKGVQVDLLEKHLKKTDPERDVLVLHTGKLFREFGEGEGYSNKMVKKITKEGGLMPLFLTIGLWAQFLMRDMKEGAHLITDGTPRKQREAEMLHFAFEFYTYHKPHVVYINVGHQWAGERLLQRGRVDDTPEAIQERFKWFEEEVMPTAQWYRTHPDYHFVEINGEQSIEDVHREILEKLF